MEAITFLRFARSDMRRPNASSMRKDTANNVRQMQTTFMILSLLLDSWLGWKSSAIIFVTIIGHQYGGWFFFLWNIVCADFSIFSSEKKITETVYIFIAGLSL